MDASSSSPQRTRRTRRFFSTALILCVLGVLCGGTVLSAQEPPAPQAISAAQLQTAIDKLGDLDYNTRTAAARTIRRTAAPQAVTALLQAVAEHADGFVRYRALVLLMGFNDPRAKDAMRLALVSPNDRLRTVGYAFFEHNPDPSMAGAFVSALDTEQGEFVRPALVRALAAATVAGASAADARARQALVRDVSRGEDYFRSVVIEALGDYKAAYAFDALTNVAKLDGPLQDDAALALGKLGDRRALVTLGAIQRTAPRQVQPTIATAICLIGLDCESHERFLVDSLKYADKNSGFQELLRAAAAGLGALAVSGRHDEAVDGLFEVGIPAGDSTRAPISLALATVALRNTPLMLSVLAKRPDRQQAIDLVSEGFDRLEEDLDKERFFAVVRRTYWDAGDGSPTRVLMQTLIGKLDF
jgi:HEAT repeat protein